jgi:hypothetical protein
MADENQELQRQMEDLRNAMQGLDAATKNANVGLQAFGKAAKNLPADIAKGMGGFAKTVAQGDTSLKSMNAVVDVAANAVSGLAKTIPYVGEALSALAKGVAEGAKLVVEQLDQTAKAFNQVAASGATVADGMTGLRRQFTTAGLSLQQFQKVVGQNATALARFRGIAGEGAEDFSAAVGKLTQGQDDSLRKIGMSAEDISQTAGSFVTQQTRLGKSQSMTQDQLTAGTKQYALELDQLSKVTGMSREAIQKQQDAALSEGKFRANYDEMIANGNERQAKALMDLQTRMQSFGAELGQGTRDLASGAANTDAAKKMVASTGGAALDIIARLKEGSIDQNQAQKELQDAYKRNGKMLRDNAKYMGDSNDSLNAYAQVSDFVSANIEGNGMKAAKTQKAQLDKTDQLTDATVVAQKNIEQMNIQFNLMATDLMPQAADATKAMTKAMTDMVKWIRENIGGGDQAKKDAAAETARRQQTAVTAAGEIEYDAMGNAISGGPAAGPAPAAAPSAPAAAAKPTTSSDLKGMGLKIKEGDVQKEGSGISPTLIDLAKKIQESVPGFAYFSGFNDNFHQEKASSSEHTKGLALDFALSKRPSKEEGSQIASVLKGLGASYVQDEYNDPSSKATAGHFHAAVSARNGAILSGPTSGYKPNLTMHGTEAVVPLNSPQAQSMMGNSDNTEIMVAQLEKLEEMVAVMKNQLSVSTKIMQFAS